MLFRETGITNSARMTSTCRGVVLSEMIGGLWTVMSIRARAATAGRNAPYHVITVAIPSDLPNYICISIDALLKSSSNCQQSLYRGINIGAVQGYNYWH